MTSVQEIQDRADELAARLEYISERAGLAATKELRAEIASAKQQLVKAWVQEYGSVNAGPSSASDVGAISTTAALIIGSAVTAAFVATDAITMGWINAYVLGIQHALSSSLDTGQISPDHPSPFPPHFDVVRPIAHARIRAQDAVSPEMIRTQGFSALSVAMIRADQAVAAVQAVTDTYFTGAAATAVTEVAAITGWNRMWVAERDACVHCLAYSGQTTDTGVFPTGLTFGDRPLIMYGILTGPPLHPHCRCVLELVDPDNHAIPTALKREAKRSVLRGFSLDSESEASRLRAAQRLLAHGSTLPESVKQYARRAVRRGEFPRGRDVPTGERRP